MDIHIPVELRSKIPQLGEVATQADPMGAQRAQAHKKTVAEWVRVGAVIRGSELRDKYTASLLKHAEIK